MYGYLSFLDWLWFFAEMWHTRNLYGLRVLKGIIVDIQSAPFVEIRKSKTGYRFDHIKGSYSMPT